jgi:hypothetical protein
MLLLPTSCPDCYGFTMEVDVGLDDPYEARCVSCGYSEECYLQQVRADQLRESPDFRHVRRPSTKWLHAHDPAPPDSMGPFPPRNGLYCGEVKYFRPPMICTGKSMRPTVPAVTATRSLPLRRLCRPRIGCILARPKGVRLP